MKMRQALITTRILSVIGQQGVGKSTLAKMVAELLNAQFIECSDVVRDICGDMPRGEMWKTNVRTKFEPGWLGNGIKERITSSKVILSGNREQEVHETLSLDKGARVIVCSLWAPQQERYIRIKNIGKVSSYAEFITQGQNELGIGLKTLLRRYPPKYVTSSHVELSEVADLIVNDLSKEWRLLNSHI